MLSENDFQHWCDRLNLPTKSRQLIEKIRSSEPSRLVRGRSSNVCERYPSQKMGRTIQFESHRVEAPKIYELEQDLNVLEYYDQPPPIKLNYKGCRAVYKHTEFYWELNRTTSLHKDRPYEISRIDHTELNKECYKVAIAPGSMIVSAVAFSIQNLIASTYKLYR